MNILAVGIGGAFGALLRGLISHFFSITAPAFPITILLINLVGSFFLAYFSTWPFIKHLTIRLLITTGILGSFTTFSTFSAELFSLIQFGEITKAILYASCSMVGGILCSFVGFKCGGGIWRS